MATATTTATHPSTLEVVGDATGGDSLVPKKNDSDVKHIRKSLHRRWTCSGFTEANSVNKIRKRIDFPLYDVKGLSENAFNKMLRYTKAMDHLRSLVVDSIIVKSIHRLAGLTRKETRKKVDSLVDRHLKNLPMKWQNLQFGVADILAQMRLVLKYKRRRLCYAVACSQFNSGESLYNCNVGRQVGVGAEVVLMTVTVLCAERIKMLTILPTVLNSIAVAVPDTEMMNLGSGLVMDKFVVQLKPECCAHSGLGLEKLIESLLPDLDSPKGSGEKVTMQYDHSNSAKSLRFMMRIELWDAALLVVLENLLGLQSSDNDLSMLTVNMTRFDNENVVTSPEASRIPDTDLKSDIISNISVATPAPVNEHAPVFLSLDDITVTRMVSFDQSEQHYQGILNSTGAAIFIKGTQSLLQEMLNASINGISLTGVGEGNPPITLTVGEAATVYLNALASGTDTVSEGGPILAPVYRTSAHSDVAKRIEFDRELSAMCRLGVHENVCKCVGYFHEYSRGLLVCYDFVKGGNLTNLIKDETKTYNIANIALDIARGMAYLHQHGVMHRDLKSDNIVIESVNKPSPLLSSPTASRSHSRSPILWEGTAKICDFGLACVFDDSRNMTAETGTYRWMAPEIIRHEKYSFPADVYSFGILIWELASRDHPYSGLTPIQAAFSVAKHDLRPNIPDGMHPRLKAIMTRCWHPTPAARPTFDDIVDLMLYM